MGEVLRMVGQIAGLGGLALGIFLLLFRQIRLPSATRRHLTLFMWLVWSIAALGLICYTIGELFAPNGDHEATTISEFHDPVLLTGVENGEFVAFLNGNIGTIVFLDTYLDSSLSIGTQQDIAERFGIDVDLIATCQFDGVPLPLPNEEQELITLTFHFLDDHVLNYSAGGTGIVTVAVRGFYEISRTIHGGPLYAFHLKEVAAPIDVRARFMNR
jgi:hypothetical protein